MRTLRKILLLCLVTCTLFPFLSFAETDATIVLTPENPSPKSNISLSFESYSFDVNIAMITWYKDGKIVSQGQGKKTITLKTGDVGETTQVRVVGEIKNGQSVEQIINITPSSIVIVYEAPFSYIPLLYEGRPLPSDGGLVQVTAFPQMSDNGVPVSPSSLSYTWYVEDSVIKKESGTGRQSALLRLDYLENSTTIKVVIRTPFGNVSSKTITIYPHKIMPLLYTYDDILGTNFNSLVGKRLEVVDNFSLSLEPFYVSTAEKKDPSYIWFLDGLPSTPLGGRILALQPKKDSYGSKTLTVAVSSATIVEERGEVSTELIFDTRK